MAPVMEVPDVVYTDVWASVVDESDTLYVTILGLVVTANHVRICSVQNIW